MEDSKSLRFYSSRSTNQQSSDEDLSNHFDRSIMLQMRRLQDVFAVEKSKRRFGQAMQTKMQRNGATCWREKSYWPDREVLVADEVRKAPRTKSINVNAHYAHARPQSPGRLSLAGEPYFHTYV